MAANGTAVPSARSVSILPVGIAGRLQRLGVMLAPRPASQPLCAIPDRVLRDIGVDRSQAMQATYCDRPACRGGADAA